MRTSAPRPIRLAVVSAALVLVTTVAGCSASSSDAKDPKTTTTAADKTTTSGDKTASTVDRTTSTVGSDGDYTEEDYVDAINTAVQDDAPDGFKDPDACFAQSWVDTIGAENIADAGVTPDDITSDFSSLGDVVSEDQLPELAAAFGTCDIDIDAIFSKSLIEDQSLTEAQVTCVMNKMPDDLLEEAISASMIKLETTTDYQAKMKAIGASCAN